MTREHILAEIRRTTAENGGVPLGQDRFASETGLKRHDWYGRYWTRWSEAIREAGFAPNRLTAAVPDDDLLEHLASLTRELGRFPVEANIRMKRRSDPHFPSHTTFARLGGKATLATRLHRYSVDRGYVDVAPLCVPEMGARAGRPNAPTGPDGITPGYVYLVRHGSRREFKIGRTNNRLRREGEVGVELPQPLEPVHVIETDDPAGVENYWHRRFADKRLKNEWFALTPEDVRAFKRWRKIF